MAAYFASETLVEVSEDVAPLGSHATAFDRVSSLPDLFIPIIVYFIQKLDQLSFSGKGFIRLRVSWLGRELKNVPEVPQHEGEFLQLSGISFGWRKPETYSCFVPFAVSPMTTKAVAHRF